MERLHFRKGATRKQATDVDHFIGLRLCQDALQTARPSALLHDKRNG